MMRSVTNALCPVLLLMLSASPLFAQATKPVASQSQPAASQSTAGRPAPFGTHATLGPVLQPSESLSGGRTAPLYPVAGPVWDGVNQGLWFVLADCRALLVDPNTGLEKDRTVVPRGTLLGHDGVGLWFEGEEGRWVRGQPRPRMLLQRVRTAGRLTSEQEARGWRLPEDVASSIPVDDFDVADAVASPSIARFWRLIDAGFVSATYAHLTVWFLDSRIKVIGDIQHDIKAHVQGAGYLWMLSGYSKGRTEVWSLVRASVADPEKVLHGVTLQRALNADDVLADAQGGLTWDGGNLWSSEGRRSGDPVHLIRIDVGLSRKPDTTARYNKALAFERKNGTLKAIPLFEELIAYDPAAVEIRNHLGWALAARPKEPYHDLQRARQLVESALEWQPWDPEKWDTLAEIYWRLGDNKLAERFEAKAINLNPAKTFYWKQLDKFRTQPGSDDAPEPSY